MNAKTVPSGPAVAVLVADLAAAQRELDRHAVALIEGDPSDFTAKAWSEADRRTRELRAELARARAAERDVVVAELAAAAREFEEATRSFLAPPNAKASARARLRAALARFAEG